MRLVNSFVRTAATALVLVATIGCGRKADAVTPDQLQRRYGISDAYAGDVPTSDGPIQRDACTRHAPGRAQGAAVCAAAIAERRASRLPSRRARAAPRSRETQRHARPDRKRASRRRQHSQSPTHKQKRSWEKDALIIGGSAGAGTAIGAVAGGKKGAAIGATAGGIGGLIYDLATRNKE